jgi:hypothetical protein
MSVTTEQMLGKPNSLSAVRIFSRGVERVSFPGPCQCLLTTVVAVHLDQD